MGSGRLPVVAVRAARVGDLDGVVAIERVSFGDPWPEQAFHDAVGDPGLVFLVASDESCTLGYVVGWFVAGEGEIANLAVAPAVRGRGIGGALLDAALASGTHVGTEAIYLEVRESNAAARALYGSRGFEVIGRRPGYYRSPVEDAIVLRKACSGSDSGRSDSVG